MAVFDVTDRLSSGKPLSYEDGCVMVLRLAGGGLTLTFDGGLSRSDAARALSQLGTLLAAPRDASDVSPAGGILVAGDVAGQKHEITGIENNAAANVNGDVSEVDPERITEDLIRWQDGYAAYKLPCGGWWWVRWHSDTGEMWGLAGPRMGAVAVKKGPFDNFDDTLASMMLHRARGKKITEGDCKA